MLVNLEAVSGLTCIPPPLILFQVGEGTFAEVYAAVMPEMPAAWATATDTGEAAMAFKVMPLGGDTHINDEPQKTAAEMMTEVMATVELSRLTTAGAPSFIRALSVSICTGSYPTALLTAWDDWKEANASECENERPVRCYGRRGESVHIFLPTFVYFHTHTKKTHSNSKHCLGAALLFNLAIVGGYQMKVAEQFGLEMTTAHATPSHVAPPHALPASIAGRLCRRSAVHRLCV